MEIVATYRLQLRPEFGFDAVAQIAPYLARLGVSHVYLSPFLQAGTGSTHGYDVVDHRRVNPELGGDEGYRRMCTALRENGLRQVADVVPNHMSIAEPERNPWWWDVLENGPASIYAGHFDVDWEHPERRLRDRVVVPMLGDHYGRVLRAKAIQLERDGGRIVWRVYERRLPVAPRSLAVPLARAAAGSASDELAFLADCLERLPPATLAARESRQQRHRDRVVIGRQLARMFGEQAEVARAVDGELARINASEDELHAILERQNFRLAYWRAARQDLDYRRFFDINELAGLRVEDPAVFFATHERILGWVSAGEIDGLRIDHPDGLRDPRQYFQRLRAAAPEAWIVAEKILEGDEPLPADWPIDGTTGYDFLNRVGGLFVDPRAAAVFDRIYASFAADEASFDELCRAKKRLVLRDLLGSDLSRLTEAFVLLCEDELAYRDYSRDQLRAALAETLVRLPVYRTYVDDRGEASERDRRIVAEAVGAAAAARADLDGDLFAFLGEVLAGRHEGAAAAEMRNRFQQLAGPTMAKGVEDTAFFCYPRLLCLNEVGGDPSRFGTEPSAFHEHALRIQRDWPRTMNATTTHDTKRSEDARLRLAVLTEIPERWEQEVAAWVRHHRDAGAVAAIDGPTEYLLYQTLVAAWPIDHERLWRFAQKAAREAKTATSWTEPNEEYEKRLERFCERLVGDDVFVGRVDAFVRSILDGARRHSLAQMAIKLCAPGVPDIYQGTELWDDSLTDPDNRRPVDFAARAAMLDAVEKLDTAPTSLEVGSAEAKLWMAQRLLLLRRRHVEAFGPASGYRALAAEGSQAERVVGFLRDERVAVVIGRWWTTFDGDWGGTFVDLPEGRWTNVLADGATVGDRVPMARLLERFPVAVLERGG